MWLNFLIEKIMNDIEAKPMTDKYYNSLPDDKKYAYYNPNNKNTKYWSIYYLNQRIGYSGIIFEENKYFGIVYIEKKYRNKNLLKLIYKKLFEKCNCKKLYAKVEKDNIQSMKAHKKLSKKYKEYDEDHIVFEINIKGYK